MSDRSRADGRYPIVASEGTDFVVKTPKGLAKTGTQIVPTKATIELVGGTVKLKYRAIGQVVADLREQCVTGSLTISLLNKT